MFVFFFNDTATTEIYTLSLHDALPILVGSDFSEGMLDIARLKAPALTWEWGNALELPYEDDSFDAATVGFGARNFSDLDRDRKEHTSELQSRQYLVCRLLLEKKTDTQL